MRTIQCTCNVTLRRVDETIVAVGKAASIVHLCVRAFGCGWTDAGVCLRACSLSNPACMAAILSSATTLAPSHFSTLSHKPHNFRKKVIEHKMCVLVFSTKLIWNISKSRNFANAPKNWVTHESEWHHIKMGVIWIFACRYSILPWAGVHALTVQHIVINIIFSHVIPIACRKQSPLLRRRFFSVWTDTLLIAHQSSDGFYMLREPTEMTNDSCQIK